LNGLFIEEFPQGCDNPFPVFLRCRIRVDLNGMKILDAPDRGYLMADILAEYIREIRRGIGCDEEGLISFPGQPHGGGAAHGAFADAAFTAEKYKLYFISGGHY
jgi:hypothetical protein